MLKKNQKINNNIDWSKTFELSRKETLSLNIVKNNDNRNRCYDTIILYIYNNIISIMLEIKVLGSIVYRG